MGFKIDLGLNEKRERNTTVDVVAAAEAMNAAEMSLVKCETEKAIVVAAAENLERGVQLSQAIAEKTQDEGVALAVGNEALVASMRMLGQASVGESLTAGTESFTAGVEASEGMLKKMIDKAKEYAKKVWDFIRNLIAKVVKWVKALFGKGDDTATQLKELLKKAKDDKRTKLNTSEFDTTTATRLIKQVKYIAKLRGDKGVDETAVMDNLGVLSKGISAVKELSLKDALGGTMITEATAAIENADDNITLDSLKNSIISDIDILDEKNQGKIQFTDELKNDQDMIEEELDSDIETAMVMPLFLGADSLSVLVIYTNIDDATMSDFKAATKIGKEAVDVAKKAVDGIKVKVITISPSYDDVKEYEGKMEPIPFNSADNIVKKLEKVTKNADTIANKLEKNADKVAKEFNKALDDLEKTEAVKNNTPGVKGSLVQLTRSLINLAEKSTQEVAKHMASQIREAARPKWGDIVKESIRLYEK